jgi:hypothetical protein
MLLASLWALLGLDINSDLRKTRDLAEDIRDVFISGALPES